MSTKAALSLGVAAVIALAGVCADAASTSSSFTTQITITSSCTILGTAALNFGNQGVIGVNVPATSTLQVQCTNSTPYNIGLDVGTGLGATPPARIMTAGLATVVYSIYIDSAHTTIWAIPSAPTRCRRWAMAPAKATRCTALCRCRSRR
jgi:spore coat protein U-like protein